MTPALALAPKYGAPGLEADLLFSYRKSRSYVHLFTAPGALRPPHRDLSIDCKIFFCHKIGRTGRHACGGQWRCKGHAARAQREEKICTRRSNGFSRATDCFRTASITTKPRALLVRDASRSLSSWPCTVGQPGHDRLGTHADGPRLGSVCGS